ncbi:MAG: DUF2892 domain-containing protein [Bacteroidota bacterium]
MKQNMGSIDKSIRIIAALVIAVLYFANVISGTVAIVLGFFALIFLLTSFVGFCPLYAPFKFSTKPAEKAN